MTARILRHFGIFIAFLVMMASSQVALAAATISTTFIGTSSQPTHRVVQQTHVMKNVGNETIYGAGSSYLFDGPVYPQTHDDVMLVKVVVEVDGVKVCQFAGNELQKDQPVTCMIGDLQPGQSINTTVFLKANKPGNYINGFIGYHNGRRTPASIGIFFE